MSSDATSEATAEGLQQALLAWFPPSPTEPLATRKPFSETDLRGISDILRRTGRVSWSRIPRIYATLRIIEQLSTIDDFLSQGISDVWFPFSQKTLPGSVKSQTGRFDFLEAQHVVLSKALDLEKEHGKHRHFSKPADIPFVKVAELGKGAFGYVDKVLSTISYKEYARKLIPRGRNFRKDQEILKDFEKELATLKKLSHVHIVELVGSYTDPRFVGIIMSPVAEYNLKELLELAPLKSDRRSFLRTFYGCLAAALRYLHENQIKHKDIKPQNVLVRSHEVYLTDFGISRDWSEHDHSTTTGFTIKTPRYAAPEVAAYGPRNSLADIWSLGCVYLEIWTILCGETLSTLATHMSISGTKAGCYYQNTAAINSWCEETLSKTPSVEIQKPYEWIMSMLKHDARDRCSAQILFDQIQETNDNPDVPFAFTGTCCAEDDHSAESVISSVYEYDISGTTQISPLKGSQGQDSMEYSRPAPDSWPIPQPSNINEETRRQDSDRNSAERLALRLRAERRLAPRKRHSFSSSKDKTANDSINGKQVVTGRTGKKKKFQGLRDSKTLHQMNYDQSSNLQSGIASSSSSVVQNQHQQDKRPDEFLYESETDVSATVPTAALPALENRRSKSNQSGDRPRSPFRAEQSSNPNSMIHRGVSPAAERAVDPTQGNHRGKGSEVLSEPEQISRLTSTSDDRPGLFAASYRSQRPFHEEATAHLGISATAGNTLVRPVYPKTPQARDPGLAKIYRDRTERERRGILARNENAPRISPPRHDSNDSQGLVGITDTADNVRPGETNEQLHQAKLYHASPAVFSNHGSGNGRRDSPVLPSDPTLLSKRDQEVIDRVLAQRLQEAENEYARLTKDNHQEASAPSSVHVSQQMVGLTEGSGDTIAQATPVGWSQQVPNQMAGWPKTRSTYRLADKVETPRKPNKLPKKKGRFYPPPSESSSSLPSNDGHWMNSHEALRLWKQVDAGKRQGDLPPSFTQTISRKTLPPPTLRNESGSPAVRRTVKVEYVAPPEAKGNGASPSRSRSPTLNEVDSLSGLGDRWVLDDDDDYGDNVHRWADDIYPTESISQPQSPTLRASKLESIPMHDPLEAYYTERYPPDSNAAPTLISEPTNFSRRAQLGKRKIRPLNGENNKGIIGLWERIRGK